MLRQEQKDNYQEFRKKFKNLDRKAIVNRVMKCYGWNRRQAIRATIRYLMFLFIASLHPDVEIVPTCEIDRVWEQHILNNTGTYIQNCENLFGRVIHHASEDQLWENEHTQNSHVAFVQTKVLFERYFGRGVLGDFQMYELGGCGRPREV